MREVKLAWIRGAVKGLYVGFTLGFHRLLIGYRVGSYREEYSK